MQFLSYILLQIYGFFELLKISVPINVTKSIYNIFKYRNFNNLNIYYPKNLLRISYIFCSMCYFLLGVAHRVVGQNIPRQQINLLLGMQSSTAKCNNRKESQQNTNILLSQMNESIVILKYIEPPRQLLKSNNRMNCAYRQQFNTLPYIFKYCQQLHPLASNERSQDYVFDPDLIKNIYRRDLELKINPFETKNYFKSTHQAGFRNNIVKAENKFDGEELCFDSHFESGNLLSADKELGKDHHYHLMMQNDINTYGCTQWFFFRVNNKNPLKATFFINNFYKPQSLYQKGMKILIFSMKKFLNEGVGWVRGGQQIAYFRNKITERKKNGGCKQFYSLKFIYHFEYEMDETYFAYNYPYTYSRLNSYLIEKDMAENAYYNCRTLCKTAAENKIFLVTITDNSVPKSKKNSIFITSRVHPGQTVSSLMMEGIINFLSSKDPIAQVLRSKFVFKLVPMLNPDGVIHGNYRTNLAGIDLNRVWDLADKLLSPQIYQLKKHITEFNKQCPIIMFCDLHGHSARKSAFIYGCENDKIKIDSDEEQSRLFPFMLSFLNQDFRYKSCNFTVQRNKRGTARIQLWKQLKIPNIFTLQASFCSAENSEYHFRPNDYSEIGVSFCKNIYEYFLNHEKRKQFSNKLKNNNEYQLQTKNDSQDSESDNDLLDKKTINELKKGEANDVWNRRRMIIPKPIIKISEEFREIKEKKTISRRRYISEKSQRPIKTEGNSELSCSILSINSRKTIVTAIPTKRITLDTQVLKPQEPRGGLKNSIFQRIEHNYRGKSSIYRIQRKNLKNTIVEPYLKKSTLFQDQSSFDLY